MGYETIVKVNKALEDRLKNVAAEKQTVKVGVIGNRDTTNRKGVGGMTNAMLAQIHEFGVPQKGIPERSFIRGTAKKENHQIAKEQAILLNSYIKGNITLNEALKILGESITSKMKRFIRDGIAPELTEARKKQKTVNGKSGDTPLIDTGQLLNSISYEVEK